MNVLKVDYTADNASAEFARSLRETGFGVLYNHPIDQKLIDEVYEDWRKFFADEALKEKYMRDPQKQDGYFPPSISETAVGAKHKDLKEFYHIYPDGRFPEELSQKSLEMYRQLSELAKTLLVWIEEHLPQDIAQSLSMPLTQMIEESPQTLLRIIHYPPLSEDIPAGAVRAAAHGDINLLTALVGATTSGLQVQDTEGNWYDVPCDRESIAVNIGDMLQKCTDGYYKSTIHRVVNPDANDRSARLSMPLFLHPRPEVVLKPGLTADEYLNERLTAIGVK